MKIIENIIKMKLRFGIKSEESKEMKSKSNRNEIKGICALQNRPKDHWNLQFFMLEAQNNGEYCNEYGQNDAGQCNCKCKFINVRALGDFIHWHWVPQWLSFTQRLVLSVMSFFLRFIEIVYNMERAPVQFEARIFKNCLHRCAFVCAGGNFIQRLHFIL